MRGEKELVYLWQAGEEAGGMTLDDWLEQDRLSIPVLEADFSTTIMSRIRVQEKTKMRLEKRGFQQAINN